MFSLIHHNNFIEIVVIILNSQSVKYGLGWFKGFVQDHTATKTQTV